MKKNDISFIYLFLASISLIFCIFIFKEYKIYFTISGFAFIIMARIEYLIYKIENDKNKENNKKDNI